MFSPKNCTVVPGKAKHVSNTRRKFPAAKPVIRTDIPEAYALFKRKRGEKGRKAGDT